MKKNIFEVRWNNRKQKKDVVLSVSGSRTLSDERVKIILLEQIKKHEVTKITTHGEPEGVCSVARKLCKEKTIPLTLHFLDFTKLRGAFYHRTIAAFYDCDIAVFIHDGKSKGCQNEYEMAKKMGIPNEYFKLEIPEHKKSIGFEIENEWIDLELPEIELIIDNNEVDK